MIRQGCTTIRSEKRSGTTDVSAIMPLLTAGTGIPGILRFTEPRKFQSVK
jgi:hypothetical protein